MSVRTIKGYFLTVLSGLVILAAALLIVLQWGNKTVFSLYGKNYGSNTIAEGGLNTALVILASAAGGIVLLWVCKMMISGVRILLSARKARKAALTPRAPQET